jgi:hypothetical protein
MKIFLNNVVDDFFSSDVNTIMGIDWAYICLGMERYTASFPQKPKKIIYLL